MRSFLTLFVLLAAYRHEKRTPNQKTKNQFSTILTTLTYKKMNYWQIFNKHKVNEANDMKYSHIVQLRHSQEPILINSIPFICSDFFLMFKLKTKERIENFIMTGERKVHAKFPIQQNCNVDCDQHKISVGQSHNILTFWQKFQIDTQITFNFYFVNLWFSWIF